MMVCWTVIHFTFLLFFVKPGHSSPEDSITNCKKPSLTTASGKLVTKGTSFCPGDLIFEDNFDFLDFDKWQHENTLAGGGNWEFQWYTNNRSNSFTKDGSLYIRPTLTSDLLGEQFLTSGSLNIHGGAPADQCTNPSFWGCERTGTPTSVINPVRSARLRTPYSFSFKFGKLQVRAKMPSGDWLWPAIWLLPRFNSYGSWPTSGEIDLVESRGNQHLIENDKNIGSEFVSSTLHFGPYPAANAYYKTNFGYNSAPGEGLDKDFHIYELIWSPDSIQFKIDDTVIGNVDVGEGFWKLGKFCEIPNITNPWENGSPVAPFDQEFYLIISLAVGGISYFPDNAINPGGKPWKNTSPHAATDFWNGREQWLPTWNLDDPKNDSSSFLIDYVRVYAL